MPYCPLCRTEYRRGFTQCNDCGADLVAELPDMDSDAGANREFRPAKLAGFLLPAEAEMVKGVLEENGIRAFVRGQVDPIGITSGAEQVALLVDEQDLEDAREIYNAFFGEPEEGGYQEDGP